MDQLSLSEPFFYCCKIHITKFTVLTIFRCTVQGHPHCCTATTIIRLPKLKPHTHQSQPLILLPLSPGDLCSVPRSVSIDLTTLRTSFVLVEPYSIYPCVSGLLHVARCPPDSPMYVRTSFLLGTASYFIYTHTHTYTHTTYGIIHTHTPHMLCVHVCVHIHHTWCTHSSLGGHSVHV